MSSAPEARRTVRTPGRPIEEVDADQLDDRWRALGHDEVDAANRAHDGRFVHWHHDDGGALHLRGRLPAEDGALVLKALELALEPAPPWASAWPTPWW
ncbi:MAG: hypothetical protein ACR2K0_04970 [Acidimicrobiales bacterium]